MPRGKTSCDVGRPARLLQKQDGGDNVGKERREGLRIITSYEKERRETARKRLEKGFT